MPVQDAYTEPVEWRRLGPRLWVGRLDGAPRGMIERGRHYTATDSSERIRGTFKSLAEAQAALTPPSRRATEPERSTPGTPEGPAMVVGTSSFAVLAATMASVGLAVFV